jgi:hypothetical protein
LQRRRLRSSPLTWRRSRRVWWLQTSSGHTPTSRTPRDAGRFWQRIRESEIFSDPIPELFRRRVSPYLQPFFSVLVLSLSFFFFWHSVLQVLYLYFLFTPASSWISL